MPGKLDGRGRRVPVRGSFAVGGAIADDGIPPIAGAGIIQCGLRPGYLRSAYERIVPVCDHALAWNTHVTVA